MTQPTETLVSTLAKDWALEVRGTSDLAYAFESDTDLFTATAHGLVNGDTVAFGTGEAPDGFTVGTTYYVIASTANTFQLSATEGGAAVTGTADDTGTATYPSWVRVGGLTQVAPSVDTNMEDDSDFDGDGWGSDQVTQRKWKIECEGRRKRRAGQTAYVADPGQEIIRAAGEVVGIGATVEVRWYRKDGAPDAYTGYAAVQWGGGGGSVTDLEPFSFTLNGQGKRTAITNPTAEEA